MFDGRYLDWNQKRIKAIIDYYGHTFMQGKKVLDLGCGHADIGGALYRLGANVTALDARQDHLKIVNKKFPGIKTVKADLDGTWPLQGQQFDLVLDLDILCHLYDYEQHLKNVCASATNLVIESAVCDSLDEYKVLYVEENKNVYDLAVNGQGSRPSAAAIERVLRNCGFAFKRHDSARFNSGNYVYDWVPKFDDSYNPNHRRIWFATKVGHAQANPTPETVALVNASSPTNKFQGGRPLHNPKLPYPPPSTPYSKPPIRAALCISGHLRTFLDNYKSVKENILDRINCDVFIHTWETLGLQYRHTDSTLHVMETKNLVDRINQLYSPIKMVIEPHKNFMITPLMRQRLIDHRDIGGILSMFYKIEECNNLKKRYEQEGSFTYDYVIRFRGDLWVEQPIPIDGRTKINQLFLPMYGNFGGACDQFAFGSSEIMDKYSSLYSNLETHLMNGAPMQPEKLLQFHIEKMNLPVTKVHFKYVIRRANGLIQDNMLLERAIGLRR